MAARTAFQLNYGAMTKAAGLLSPLTAKLGIVSPPSTLEISCFGADVIKGLNHCLVMSAPPIPLEPMFQEMAKALEHGLYYLALQMALSVPDICSAMEVEGEARYYEIGKRYKAWCGRYVDKLFLNFTSKDCWSLRGGIVHTGMAHGHKFAQFSRVIFTFPDGSNNYFNDNTLTDGENKPVIQLEITFFCRRMMLAAHEWWEDKWDDAIVSKAAPNLVRLRPNGFSLLQGIPVIA